MKLGIIITARTGSTRLPGKALRPLHDIEAIRRLIRRCKKSRYSKTLILATTARKEDDVLERIAKEEGILCFRGSTEDIVARHHGAVSEHGLDGYINVDGDDMLCDPTLMDVAGAEMERGGWDCVMLTGFPLGLVPLGISASALSTVFSRKKSNNTETGWTRFFMDKARFRVKEIEAKESVRRPEIRLTVDYPEDFALVENIMSYFSSKGVPYESITTRGIVEYLSAHPEVNSMNDSRKEEYWKNYNMKATDTSLAEPGAEKAGQEQGSEVGDMKKEKDIRFLIIGLGSMGKRRIRNLHYLGHKDVIAFEPKEERRKEAEEKHGIRAFGTLDEALAQEPDAIIISTPPNLHTIYAKKAAEAGKHFFIEASVINDGLEEVDRIAKSKGVVAAPSCTMRFKGSIAKVKELVDAGAIGKVLGFTYHMGQYLPDWHPWEDISKFYVGKRDTGAAREMVSFESEWLTWIFGDVEKLACMKGKFSDMKVDIDDIYAIIYKFRSGPVGALMIDVVARAPSRTLRVLGSRGNIIWDWDSSVVRVYDADKKAWTEHKEVEKVAQQGYWAKDDMYIEEMRAFVDAIRGRKDFGYTLSDDIAILDLLVKSEKSSDQGAHMAIEKKRA